ncbi:multiple monosaccharide ABC transporter substrate-binding protein [Microbacterium azadirachtae]|uniref:multiple monosaccharide ABC transporter substrate-binding protein n=1 Tax=Microbacterium azadirachtae TaxID=582680 RepID=UPI00088A4B5C|nr:multiple monosaccharide ABC transporter substrate-binding protein [Microbacterium azadirachtae]SDM13723.1 monosaccharide ABC transporter substrate-binding protein, CUT2 family [Microbacterium azadirachtae]SEG37810.1 monosaccharide ABC transporter substrate-binding protein, CUT2 family [Microbacterium azadirachtae]SEG40406.1 monosaccharide ABC transporter substrate-binding protein, CUT2 family [Microbacterium azadirachtae]
MKFSRLALGAAAVALALTMTACAGTRGGGGGSSTAEPGANKGALVGVAMPTKTSTRWIHDGDAVKAGLEKLGYKVDLEYADDDIPTQVQQISNMLTKGAKVLVVASVDGTALSSQLDQAASKGVKVIAYDRLINGNKNVDYYTTFDNYKVGVQQATSLLEGLGVLDKSGKDTGAAGPFNIELFAGSPDDNNATFFFNGAMDTLKPYLDKGVLKVGSGQTGFTQVATQGWQADVAKKRMQDLIASTYSNGQTVNGVLSPYDGLSIGIISALIGAGYATDKLPIITGQDAEIPSVKSIIAGQQYSTIYKDTRKLAGEAVKMTDDLLNGKTPEVNDTKSYDNKTKVVPTFLFQPVVVTKDNYKEAVIDTGYYTEDQLK